ncbi:MAG: peptidylprolyl isomerase [Solirubrobacterales bacterium]
MPSERNRAKVLAAISGIAALVVLVVVLVLPDGGGEEPQVVVKAGKVAKPVPGETVAKGATASARFVTNKGAFTVELDTTGSPIAADNFAYLVESGFYDGLGFHRIVPDFVIQGGDPRGNGTGGPGYSVVERPAPDTIYGPGTVAMAKSATEPAGSAGSQFFVVTASKPIGLPPDYAVVGKVSRGIETVREIGRLGGPDEQPTETVVIESARLLPG